MGQLLKALRQRAELHPTFDDQLARFLKYRNVIAHRLHDVPGGLDLHSDEGRRRLKVFLLQYMDDGQKVSMVLLGLLREWARQEDINLPNEHHLSQRMLDDLEANVEPNLQDLIRSRERGVQPQVSNAD